LPTAGFYRYNRRRTRTGGGGGKAVEAGCFVEARLRFFSPRKAPVGGGKAKEQYVKLRAEKASGSLL